MNPTQVFQTLSQTEPFFTVSSSSHYRKRNMSCSTRNRFWQEGQECVDAMFQLIGGGSFRSVLDYGCGVGRLLRCTLPYSDVAYGVDISPALLEKASEVCPSANLMRYSEWVASPPQVEFSYSIIVFQHIPQQQGLVILDRLLSLTGKTCAFHIVVGDPRPWLVRFLFHLSFVPFFAGLSNWFRGRAWKEPRIPMFCWNIENVQTSFQKAGFKLTIHPLPGCAEPWESYLFVGHKE